MAESASDRELQARRPNVAERQRGLSIFLKLLILIVSLVLGVGALLTSYLVSRQVAELRVELERKALTYAQLTSKQVESAIAFDDQETAREVFDSVAGDQDIESLTLFTAQGTILRARGAISPTVSNDLKQVSTATPFALVDRIGVVVPVVSLEGPRGTLVIELSTRRLSESRAQVLRRAAVAGLLAALCAALGAFLIARTLARRLSAIATVADAVAAGDLAQPPVREDAARDEIGVLARAFNTMLRQLQELIAQIRDNARQEQERLETLVQARTAELAGRNDDLRRVLDNVGQGFLTVGRDGQIATERSAVLTSWFSPVPDSGLFVDFLATIDTAKAEWFAVGWESVLDGVFPPQVTLDQLPKRFDRAGRHFEFEYRPVLTDEGEVDRVVVVITDATAALHGARAESDEREATRLFSRMIADRKGLLEFFAEAQLLVESVQSNVGGSTQLRRSLHTLKGNAAMYGIDSLAQLSHELEDRLSEQGTLSERDLEALVVRWAELRTKIVMLLGDQRGNIEIEDREYREIIEAVERRVPHERLREMIWAWRLEPTHAPLKRLAEQAESLASRLGKGPIAVQIESNQICLLPERWSSFWSAAVHVVRNAIDHGFETLEKSQSATQVPKKCLTLRTRIAGDVFMIEFADNGRGVAWDTVRLKATALGLPIHTQADLVRALFADGLSTRDTVTEVSGRGVGLGAVLRACEVLGGSAEVESSPGNGTTIRFMWPTALLYEQMPKGPSRLPHDLASAS